MSNPDRVYFPEIGLTELGVAQYYLSVAEGIVRQVALTVREVLRDLPATARG